MYSSFVFLLFSQSNLPFAALPHHSPAPPTNTDCFKLTSVDWACYSNNLLHPAINSGAFSPTAGLNEEYIIYELVRIL